MEFKAYMKHYQPRIDEDTVEWFDAEKLWDTARNGDYLIEMQEYVRLTEASYQSKRDKLKKWVTHWMGKFMIVKAENNKLRSMNKALIKRINQLHKYMVKQEVKEFVKTVGNGELRELEKSEVEKVPLQC